MMSDTERENFAKLIKEHKFTKETYNRLLHKFDLENVDLEEEYTLVIKKVSRLRARQRAVVEDFLIIRDMLADQEKADAEDKEKKIADIAAPIDLTSKADTCTCDHTDPNHVCTCENGCCKVENKN